MDKKIKPSEVIAARFQVSNETAKFFLGRVQKSFKTERPPHQLVVDFMSGQSYDALPKPYQIAKALNEKGIWAYPLNSEPAEPVDEDELY
ncbi:MAG TPA: hypothetical protein PKE35_09670 [Anaerolineales bacterium]|nr:hypothetical protein [Anaerolineales bacterium]HMV95305.1 hypothetical protein [Anaerolineales bacterium]HMX18271.1 hypothetical protein [Anaerolineales bacterium]HMX74512.1 hypothetical protein [Anaerolineales bacterium]HMZ41771.1 hypothetical protein [Anaerolineales bacterium]